MGSKANPPTHYYALRTRSFGTDRVPDVWSGNIGAIEEISVAGFVEYSFVITINAK